MLSAYRSIGGRLEPLAPDDDPARAQWIDVFRPSEGEAARMAPLVPFVPSLEDMREIEISNRLYREGEALYLTVIIPGQDASKRHVSGPVTFILTPERLVSLRHHAPRPFETFPTRADQATTGCTTPPQIFLGLLEEITGRQADLLEGVATALDDCAARIYTTDAPHHQRALEGELRKLGAQGELVSRVRLGLLTLARMLNYLKQIEPAHYATGPIGEALSSLVQDITALEVHADFLSQRIGGMNDVILGLISIGQSQTTKIVSVIAVLFSPPTLIASIYGMNFAVMPELSWAWGYPAAIVAMLATAVLSLLLFRWLRWL